MRFTQRQGHAAGHAAALAAGSFTPVGDFYRRASCDLVPAYKLSRPVFGGTVERALGISYRTARAATVTVTVLRGSKVVKRFPARRSAANRTVRLSLPAKGLARGDYKVQLVAKSGSETVTLDARQPPAVSASAIRTSST